MIKSFLFTKWIIYNQMSFSKFRSLLYVFLFIASFFIIERSLHFFSDGFSVGRIFYPSQLLNGSTSNCTNQIANALNQPFYYLSCGAQCYAFASKDDKYVLKVFKFHHLRPSPLLSLLPSWGIFKQYKEKKVKKKKLELSRQFSSYILASEQLESETETLFLHLHETNDLPSISLVDKIGIKTKINPNQLHFILQKKGNLFMDVLINSISSKNEAFAKELLSSAIQNCISRCKKGIADKDPNFFTNFGVIDQKVFELDIGRFYLDEKKKKEKEIQDELIRIFTPLDQRLTTLSPSLKAFLKEQIIQDEK